MIKIISFPLKELVDAEFHGWVFLERPSIISIGFSTTTDKAGLIWYSMLVYYKERGTN